MSNTKEERIPKLTLSISGREGRIRIGKGIAKALGNPDYVCIYVSVENDALLVKQCVQKEFLSIKVHRNDNLTPKDELLLYSLRFTRELYVANAWTPHGTYQMIGRYEPKLNAVIFKFKEAQLKEI